MLDPVTLYKDGKSRRIAAIDAPGWLRSGWSLSESLAPHFPPLEPDLLENFPTTDEQTTVVIPKRRGGKNGGNAVSEV